MGNHSFCQISIHLYDDSGYPALMLPSDVVPIIFAMVGKTISTAFSFLFLFMFSSSFRCGQAECPFGRNQPVLSHPDARHIKPRSLLTSPCSSPVYEDENEKLNKTKDLHCP